MNLLRVILATVVIFAAGACTGFFLARKPAGPAASPVNRSALSSTNAPSDWNQQRDEMRASLQKEINATDEQMAKVDDILAESRKRSREIWQTVKVPMEAEVMRVQEEIRGVLDPGQAAKYEEIMKRRDKRGPGGGRDKAKQKSDPQSCGFKGWPDRHRFL